MSERSDKEISDLLEEGRILAGNKWESESNKACLGELTTEGEKEAKPWQPV